MLSPAEDYHQAIFKALLQDNDLLALLGGPHIFDRLPERIAPPYCVIGMMRIDDWSTASEDGSALTFQVHVWSKEKSRSQCNAVLQRAEEVLVNGALSLTDHHHIHTRRQYSEIRRDRNTAHFHGVTRFRGVTEPKIGVQN